MFGAETKALFAKYFQKNISQFSWCTVQLVYTSMSDKLFVFGFCYKLSNFLAFIDWYILLSSDWTIWYSMTSLKDFMLGILLLHNNFHRWPCQAIHKNQWEVECCTVILILSSNKTNRTLTYVVTQKSA